jgi:hypothetical protein
MGKGVPRKQEFEPRGLSARFQLAGSKKRIPLGWADLDRGWKLLILTLAVHLARAPFSLIHSAISPLAFPYALRHVALQLALVLPAVGERGWPV